MAISQTQRARVTQPKNPMATNVDTLFPDKLTVQRRTPLIEVATKLFAEHWTGAAGDEILIPAHDSLELETRVFTK